MLKTGCLFISMLVACSASAGVPEVKVLIGKALRRVIVEGMDLKKIIHTKKIFEQYSGRKVISFNCSSPTSKSSASLLKSPLLVASLSSPTGLISWGEQKYQGELQLLAKPGQDNCNLVNSISLESYITTLLAKEMHGSWPVEALKAQAVAARTYAYERVKKNENISGEEKLYHLESSEKDQVSGNFSDITENTIQAARETNGEVLTGPSGRIAPVFFHSKCGGKTLRPDQVWGGVEEGYRSVNCPFCKKTGMKDWQHKVKNGKLVQMIDQVLKKYYADSLEVGEVKLMPDSLANSELRLYVGDRLHIIKKSFLRNMGGREVMPSNNFVMYNDNGEFKLKGRGYGHGVGLCQLGALELAKRGYNYQQILSFYFPRHKLKKVY